MTYGTNDIENFALPLPITQTACKTAQQFASFQLTHQKAEQVRLNTLAVCAVDDYLQMIGVSTDICASDSWNPVVRLCNDVADLEVTGLGRLECRPLKMQEQTCQIPAEVWSERIGYVIVQIDESLRQVHVLGYTQTAAVDALPISQLQPLEELIERLSQLKQPVAVTLSSSITLVNLSQWLDNLFETGWQTVEALLNPASPSLAFDFRSELDLVYSSDSPNASVRRAKLIDLGIQLGDHPVALIIELRPEEQKTNILLQVQPTDGQIYLPPLLQLTVLDESGATFLEAQARSTDDYIQLEFDGTLGERFSVKVALADVSTTEDFQI